MKKAILIIGTVVLVVAIVIVCGGYYILNKPEGALLTQLEGIRLSGWDNLHQQLSEKVQKAADAVGAVTDGSPTDSVTGLFSKPDPEFLKAQVQKIRWELEDVTAGGDSAAAVLRFCYADRLSGRVSLSVIRDGQGWRLEKIAFSELERKTAP